MIYLTQKDERNAKKIIFTLVNMEVPNKKKTFLSNISSYDANKCRTILKHKSSHIKIVSEWKQKGYFNLGDTYFIWEWGIDMCMGVVIIRKYMQE